MKILYVDMDGCIAKWNEMAVLDDVAQPKYFVNCKPQDNLIQALDWMSEITSVVILSMAHISLFAKGDKNNWCDVFTPFIEKRIFIDDNQKKKIDFMNKDDESYLIDDYTLNLNEWEEAGGIGIKFLNGINNSNGSWKGYAVSKDQSAESIYNNICAFMKINPQR